MRLLPLARPLHYSLSHMKTKVKKFLGLLPFIATIGLCSIAFADDNDEHKEDRERQERKEDKERAERKELRERAERKEERERAERKEEKEKAEEKEEKEKEKSEQKEEKEKERSERKSTGDQNFYVGALIGGTKSANSDGTISESTISPTVGVTAGIKLSPRFGIGFLGSRYGMTSSSNILGLPAGTNSNTTLLLGQANFILGGFHVGVDLGPSTNSWDGTISSLNDGTSNTSFVYGPQGGIDFKLDKTISLGGEVHYLFSTAKNVVSNIQGLAVLKIWL